MLSSKEKVKKFIATTCMIVVLAGFAPPRPAPPNPYPEEGSDNTEHEIMVYSLSEYGEFYASNLGEEKEWKSSVGLDEYQDPFFGFWEEMDCTGQECMYYTSYRRRNDDVTVDSMVGTKGWHGADLVFFYGHNATISPPFQAGMFSLWRPRKVISTYGPSPSPSKAHKYIVWDYFDDITNVQWRVWGTCEDPLDPEKCEPYVYHKYPIIDASAENGYAVFYAYNPFTSVLIGKDFTEGGWLTENTWDQRPGDGRIGQLGDSDTEWVIGHGCNAVTVAAKDPDNQNEIYPTRLGVSAWSKSWSDLHMALGHYYLSFVGVEPNLKIFAYLLKYDAPIQLAYFVIHNELCDGTGRADSMPSAIAKSPGSCCVFGPDGNAICPPGGCPGDYMNSETWTDPMPDPTDGWYYYSTSYMTCESTGYVIHAIESTENLNLNAMQYDITGEAARALIGGQSIPLRAPSHGFADARELAELPRIEFVSPTDQELRTHLQNATQVMLGKDPSRGRIIEDDRALRLDLEDAVAFVVKDTGAVTVINSSNNVHDVTMVRDDKHAVNLALEQVAQSGLLNLADGESLDVIGVTATHYAGWNEDPNGEFDPVIYETSTGEKVSQYTSEYTVTFGRRYKGIPIIGPNLNVVLDASGKVVAFIKEWRDIAGEGNEPIDLMSLNTIDANRNSSIGANMRVKRMTCGYVEDIGVGVHQNYAGVGCRYLFYDESGDDNTLQKAWINAAKDGTIELWGVPIPRERTISNQNRPEMPDDN